MGSKATHLFSVCRNVPLPVMLYTVCVVETIDVMHRILEEVQT